MPGIGLVLTLFAASFSDESSSDPQLLAEAEAAFQLGVERRSEPAEARGNFLRAAELYEQLRQRGASSPALLRNLGNAYLLAGDVPKAILAYRRGLRVAPSDRRLQEGLSWARSQVAYQAGGTLGRPPVEQRPPWLPRLAAAWYLGFGFAVYCLGWFAATCWWMTRRGQWLFWSALAFTITFLLAGGLIAEELRDADLSDRPVVVISDDGVLLRTGNGLRYPPRFEAPLNRGVEARLLFVRGNWLQIELGGGEVGWVPGEYALVDAPGGD